MLLRFAALHGIPATPSEWRVYQAWRVAQLALPECRMAETEGGPDDRVCADCAGHPGCPKEHRRA